MKRLFSFFCCALPLCSVAQLNSVKEWVPKVPIVNVNTAIQAGSSQVQNTNTYLDGLGRTIQIVQKSASMESNQSGVDKVQPIVYDQDGNIKTKYLPFGANTAGGNTSINDGAFKSSFLPQQNSFMQQQYGSQGELVFYGKSVLQTSPLHTLLEEFSPGNNWAGTAANVSDPQRHSIKVKQVTNSGLDQVVIWKVVTASSPLQFGTYSFTGYYSPGQLYKSIRTDEQGKQNIEFKDKNGNIVLKKIQDAASADDGNGANYIGWISTYYIYDDFNRLRSVIQPAGVTVISSDPSWNIPPTVIDEQCFRYEYDFRNRVTLKKVPGIAPVAMIYDSRDRLVMMQDGKMKLQSNWLVTLYDLANRVVGSGIWVNTNDMIYHQSVANSSPIYPFTQSSVPTTGWEQLTETHYDDYLGLPTSLSSTFNSSWSGEFSVSLSDASLFADAQIKSTNLNNYVTWAKVKILGTANSYIVTLNIYDKKGRIIQSKSLNSSGGEDVITNLFNWSGQLLLSVQKQEKDPPSPQTTVVVSKFTYDALSRLIKIEKKLSNSLVNNGSMLSFHTIVQNEYDKLGQIKTKKLSPAFNNNAGLETESFEYNIRGWLLGMNRSYARGTGADHYFGYDLGYDKTANNLINNQTYAAPQLNGNIAGTVWRSQGDGEIRKYDFAYDNAQRLQAAGFTQYSGSAFISNANIDFSVSNMTYDPNGNINTMSQKGLKVNTSPIIDNLTYTYRSNSNVLLKVTDAVTANDNGALGDFHDGTNSNDDYTYDANGNLLSDQNKNLQIIQYNYLNQPYLITSGNNTIEYIYDANGTKLQKVITEHAASVFFEGSYHTTDVVTTTFYNSGFIYESKVYNQGLQALSYTNKLQYIFHEEGRIRYSPAIGTHPSGFIYDYFIKDQVGNVRSVISENQIANQYVARFESFTRSYETQLFGNITETAFPINQITRSNLPQCVDCQLAAIEPPNVFSYDTSNHIVSKLNGSGKKIGATLALKVMAGDKLDLAVKVWYPNKDAISARVEEEDLVSSLLQTFSGNTTNLSQGKLNPSSSNISGNPLAEGLLSFLESHPENSGDPSDPNAYLNWVLFDENLKYVPSGSGFIKVETFSDDIQILSQEALQVPKNGYLFMYLSNETQYYDVFFDDFTANILPSPLLQETHYYPFGLTMTGISSQAAGATNNIKFSSKEMQSNEFTSGAGLELYDFGARMQDPQLGRWFVADPLSEKMKQYSIYNYAFNNPLRFVDPTGMGPEDWVKDATGKIYWDNNAISPETTKAGETYLGKTVVEFKGSRAEKLGTKNNKPGFIDGDGALTATVTLYGSGGATDVTTYTGYTMGSDPVNFGAIDEGLYDGNYDAAGKHGALKSHWAVQNRGHVRMLDGQINPFAPNQVEENGEGYKDGIFIHTSNSNGFAGTYDNGTKGITVGCLLIAPNDWASFNEKMTGVTDFKIQVTRNVLVGSPRFGPMFIYPKTD